MSVAVAKKADRTAYDLRYSCGTELPIDAMVHLYGNAEVTVTLFTSHTKRNIRL